MSAHLHPSQEDLREAHGTPQEFAEAAWRACDQCFLTTDEANRAIQDYRLIFDLAPVEARRA